MHPLVRGNVDAWDGVANTLTVMDQLVSLDSATLFSDHRACVTAATGACAPITDASGLTLTSTGSGGTTAGSYVSVDGYLFGGSAGAANIVATLVSVHDVPTGTGGAFYKVEGVVTGATVHGWQRRHHHRQPAGRPRQRDLPFRASARSTACAGAFAPGDVVSVFATTAPTLPATALTATFALKRSHLPVQTAGATVEFDGSRVVVHRGLGQHGGQLRRARRRRRHLRPRGGHLAARRRATWCPSSGRCPATACPSPPRRSGSCARPAASATRSAATRRPSRPAAPPTRSPLTVLGEPIVVSSQTRLSDHSTLHWFTLDPQANPFNITTFQAYLERQRLATRAGAGRPGTADGVMQALSLTIVPASTSSQLAGPVDAIPAPVAGSSAAPATFSIDGVPVSAAVNAISYARRAAGSSIAAGDEVVISGAFTAGVLTVGATPNFSNYVVDGGTPPRQDVPLL